jgi:integrase
LFVRTRYQYGSLRLRKRERGPDVWEFRYYETDSQGERKRQSVILGDRNLYVTETQARKATQALLLRLNEESPRAEVEAATFGALLDRYVEKELSERYSTRKSHLSNIRVHIRPRWGEYPVDKMKPMAMEQWLHDLPLAPKSKTHVRGIMHLVFKCAERWGIVELGKNPVSLVRVKNASKRLKRPRVLDVAEYFELLKHLDEPHRTMVLVAQCLGLRVSEILGLQWCDFSFENRSVLVQRSVVGGRVDDVKTEYSKDDVPLDARLAEALLSWRAASFFPRDTDWVFANPVTGRPYHQESLRKRQLQRAAKLAGLGEDIGWHTFRHTYRSWLDETGAPMKVQQELMRHASIQTTMNVYGRAMTETKRRANSQVVGLVFGPNSQHSPENTGVATVQ